MDHVLLRLGEIGIIPVIRLDSAQAAPGLGRALVEGGIPAAEVTFRTDAAEAGIAALAREVPGILVGAGTVLTVDQAERAVGAGAAFIVSPCYVDEVVAFCQRRGVPVLPAVTNPDGIARGLAQGLEVLKFFPAGVAGGLPALEAFAGPFGAMRFVPTGGVNAANLGDYARQPNVLAVGGSWMVKPELVAAGDWAGVARLCREAVAALHGFAFAHMGISTPAEDAGRTLAGEFTRLFALPGREGASSIFAGDRIEITRPPFPGSHGHIAIRCNQVDRAVAYLKGAGVAVRPGTARSAKGRCQAVYLDLELGGFAVHLLQA